MPLKKINSRLHLGFTDFPLMFFFCARIQIQDHTLIICTCVSLVSSVLLLFLSISLVFCDLDSFHKYWYIFCKASLSAGLSDFFFNG